MNKLLKKYGRKFSFALYVLIFINLSIALFTVLLWKGMITGDIFKELYIVASGFLTLLASSYFFANAQSKKFSKKLESEDENKNQ